MADGRVVPWEEVYFEPFDALLARARLSGCSISINGTGGDELCARQWSEMNDEERSRRRQLVLLEGARFPSYFTRAAASAIRDTTGTTFSMDLDYGKYQHYTKFVSS